MEKQNEDLETIYVGYANQKGGCGKSTLTQLNAKALSLGKGLKVAIIECDLQGSLHNALLDYKEANANFISSYDIIIAQINEVPKTAADLFGKYDYVFIDMPGTLGTDGVINMLGVCDIMLIPIKASQYDVDSSLSFLDSVKKVKALKEKKNLPFEYYFVINAYDRQLTESKELIKIIEDLKLPAFKSTIKSSISYSRHQGTFNNPLNDKNIRFEYGIFIDEFLEVAEDVKNKYNVIQ